MPGYSLSARVSRRLEPAVFEQWATNGDFNVFAPELALDLAFGGIALGVHIKCIGKDLSQHTHSHQSHGKLSIAVELDKFWAMRSLLGD